MTTPLDLKSYDTTSSLSLRSQDGISALNLKSYDETPSLNLKREDRISAFNLKIYDETSSLNVKDMIGYLLVRVYPHLT